MNLLEIKSLIKYVLKHMLQILRKCVLQNNTSFLSMKVDGFIFT